MSDKNLQELIDNGTVNPLKVYRTYEADSDIPLYFNSDGNGKIWYENLPFNKMIISENFFKLYLKPNVKVPDDFDKDEPTINFTLERINRAGLWEEFCSWKGWDYYASAERISDWNEKVEIPLSKARAWGLI